MRPVPVSKDDLLAKVQANRDAHAAVYAEAVAAYRAQATEWHRKQAAAIPEGADIERYLKLPEPEDHTGDYDAALKMITWCTDPTIVMDQETFRQLVLDEWGWTDSWRRNTSSYSSA